MILKSCDCGPSSSTISVNLGRRNW